MTVKTSTSEITLFRDQGSLWASLQVDFGDGSGLTQVVKISPSNTAAEIETLALTAAQKRIEGMLKSMG